MELFANLPSGRTHIAKPITSEVGSPQKARHCRPLLDRIANLPTGASQLAGL